MYVVSCCQNQKPTTTVLVFFVCTVILVCLNFPSNLKCQFEVELELEWKLECKGKTRIGIYPGLEFTS
jgi:hypothetical protein